MNKIVGFFICACLLVLSSCKNDPDPVDNPVKIEFSSATGIYYGDTYEKGLGVYEVTFKGTQGTLVLPFTSILLEDDQKDITLPEGIYTAGVIGEIKEFNFLTGTDGGVFTGSDSKKNNVESGTVKVTVTDNGYSFEIKVKCGSEVEISTDLNCGLTFMDRRETEKYRGVTLTKFYGDYLGENYGTETTALSFRFTDGAVDKSANATGDFDFLYLVTFNEFFEFEDIDLQTGTYFFDPDNKKDGAPLSLMQDDYVQSDVWQSMYVTGKKLESGKLEIDVYLLFAGEMTLELSQGGYTMIANFQGYKLDENDFPLETPVDLEFRYEGAIVGADFENKEVEKADPRYHSYGSLFYYGDRDAQNIGSYKLNFFSSDYSVRSFFVIDLYQDYVVQPNHYLLELAEGTYEFGSQVAPFKAVAGATDGGSPTGSYYVIAPPPGGSTPSYLIIKEGKLEVSKSERGYRIDLVDMVYEDLETGEPAELEGMWFNGGFMQTSIPNVEELDFQVNVVSGEIDFIINTLNPEISCAIVNLITDDSEENLTLRLHIDYQPRDNLEPTIPSGTYSRYDFMSEGKAEAGFYQIGQYIAARCSYSYYARYWNGDKNKDLNCFCFEDGIVTVTHNGGDNYTIDLDMTGKDYRSGQKRSKLITSYTGNFKITDERGAFD